jgi:hypothetical protein
VGGIVAGFRPNVEAVPAAVGVCHGHCAPSAHGIKAYQMGE